MRVLLVEDDEMIGLSLRDALSAQGWSVDWVKDGLLAQSAWADGDYALCASRPSLTQSTDQPCADSASRRLCPIISSSSTSSTRIHDLQPGPPSLGELS